MDTEAHFRLAEWLVDPASCRLQRDDKTVKIEPKAMTVLSFLARYPGQVVSREALEAHAWKDVIVGYDALASTIIKLRKALGDDSRHPSYIETVSKKGYRLIAPVSFDGIQVHNPSNSVLSGQRHRWPHRLLWSAAAGLLLVVLAMLVLQISRDHDPETLSQKSMTEKVQYSLAVLPFVNLSDDPEQEYFSDGITSDITTDLSKLASLRIVARQSAFLYKGKNVDLDVLRRDLDVDYVIKGSVQKSGERLRINVQLIDVNTGHEVWARRFDRVPDDVFAIQDELANYIVNSLSLTVSREERKRLAYRYTNNIRAYDLFLRAQRQNNIRTLESIQEASELLIQAINIDPDFSRAYGALAIAYTRQHRYGWVKYKEGSLDHALEMAKKAVQSGKTLPEAYWALSFVYLHLKRYDEAAKTAQQAIQLDVNYADGYGLLAFIRNWENKPKEAIRLMRKAVALNPHHTFDYPYNLGWSHYTLGQYTEAVDYLLQALERNQNAMYPRMYLVACYVNLDQLDDAEWEVEQLVMQVPNISIEKLESSLPYKNKQSLNRLLDDLRKAGMPE